MVVPVEENLSNTGKHIRKDIQSAGFLAQTLKGKTD
jgi:hypothetical protein